MYILHGHAFWGMFAVVMQKHHFLYNLYIKSTILVNVKYDLKILYGLQINMSLTLRRIA